MIKSSLFIFCIVSTYSSSKLKVTAFTRKRIARKYILLSKESIMKLFVFILLSSFVYSQQCIQKKKLCLEDCDCCKKGWVKKGRTCPFSLVRNLSICTGDKSYLHDPISFRLEGRSTITQTWSMIKEGNFIFPNRIINTSQRECIQVKINAKKFYYQYQIFFPTQRSSNHTIEFSNLELRGTCKSEQPSNKPSESDQPSYKPSSRRQGYRLTIDCSHSSIPLEHSKTENNILVEFFRTTDNKSSHDPFYSQTITPTSCDNDHVITFQTTSSYNFGFVKVSTDGTDFLLIDKVITELCYYFSSEDDWGDCEIITYGNNNDSFWCLSKGEEEYCDDSNTSHTIYYVHTDTGSWNKGGTYGA